MDTEKLTQYADYLLQCAMYRVNNINDAEDLVQETFLAALKAADRAERLGVPFRPDNPRSWLVTVLDHKYHDLLRQKYRRPTVSMDVCLELPDRADPYGELENREEAQELRRRLGRLTEIYRKVMIKHYFYGKSVSAIASELGITESAVKNRLCTGREHIGKDYAMEKFARQSYEPELLYLAASGQNGSDNSPFTLVGNGRIEMNLLILAYEKPLTVPELADAVGISTTYIEPIVDRLVKGELMKKTSDRVYTDFIIYSEEDRTAELGRVLALADRLCGGVGELIDRAEKELEKAEYYGRQRPEAKRKLKSYLAVKTATQFVSAARDRLCGEPEPYENYPDRPRGGKWYAMGNRYPADYDFGANPYGRYAFSGEMATRLFDCLGLKQLTDFEYDTADELFGKTHRGYAGCDFDDIPKLLYCVYSGKEEALSALDRKCLGKTDELIAMGYLSRDTDGRLVCEVPVLSVQENREFFRLCGEYAEELTNRYAGELSELMDHPVRLPAHLKSVPRWLRYCGVKALPAALLYRVREAGILPRSCDGPAPAIFLSVEESGE